MRELPPREFRQMLQRPQQALRRVRARCNLPVLDAPRGCVRRVHRSAGRGQMQPRRVPELREPQPSELLRVPQALQRALREPQRQAPQPSEPLPVQ